MKKIFFLILILLFWGNSFSLAEEAVYDREVSFPREIFNFHVVAPNIMRGSQPSEKGFRMLKDYCGVRTILTLRNHQGDNEWEKAIVEKLGIRFINIPMAGNTEQDIDTIERCLDIINDKSNQPIFVHCRAGKDRTGMIFAAYRVKYEHWSLEDALLEMLVYGYDRNCCLNLEKSLIKWNSWREKEQREGQGIAGKQ
jgi:tyrosine-protein phosphatase SIW14